MLSPRMPDLGALELLVVVARTGSLNAAAAEVGRTQQAVSARIASVEAQTGVMLVTRSPRGSAMTPAGTVVVEWARRLLDAAGEVDAGLTALRGDQQQRLRVAASLTIAEQLLPGWLVALRSARGGAEVTLTATNSITVAEQVRAGAADLGFVEGPDAPRGCRTRVIGRDRLVVVVPPGHLWARRRTLLSPAELAATELTTRERGSGTREALDRALAGALGGDHVAAPPALVVSTTAAVRAAVLAGGGPAVLSALVLADDLAMGRLVAVGVAGLDLSRSLRAVWLGGATPPAGAVRDLVGIAAR